MALMQSQSSRELLNQETMQHHLQTLIEGAHENWTYAILWESLYDYSGSLILGWSNGYYRGNNNSNDKAKTTTVVVEQELRKKALGKLYSVICGGLQMSSLPITERGKSDHILRSVLETTNNLHAKDADNISNIIARSGKRTL
ncbi:transcription factor myc2 [Quercus suber]|uniref:Transcription factor n=1 Tax=Quercus suber TaxID=58331 RepID=A0AAW0K5I8_QUESU